MGETVRIASTQYGYVVDACSNMRIEIRDLNTGLSALLERMGRSQQSPRMAHLEQGIVIQVWHGLARSLDQLRLWVPGVHLARAAVHEKEDDRFRLTRVMRSFRRERVCGGRR